MASQQFFLKTAPFPGEEPSKYTNLYLRHFGSGMDSIVLTPGQPKYIKGHMEGKRIAFTSASHEGRKWGLELRKDGEQHAGWEKVEIVEREGSDGLLFTTGEEGEVLEYEEEELAGEKVWKGWMVCDWAHGYPQLFWVTHKLSGELPPFCHRVQIVREML
ncbi:uncharacterized protein LY89DRAFT_688148 [Mollisia scopiformis]|uniref:DUF7907 domain-containing protein n=1 Tax=Mollisia scopiformis TaxID=149040 RepID=A0A194WWZ8_MOLSC|nr:uncharacterized protein LY89DRAFT_688148 [Mollisia scopiformis]KUJ12460.1 hypothetical protein LY89DRAFT_688148 [Mollisia scopiformis]